MYLSDIYKSLPLAGCYGGLFNFFFWRLAESSAGMLRLGREKEKGMDRDPLRVKINRGRDMFCGYGCLFGRGGRHETYVIVSTDDS